MAGKDRVLIWQQRILQLLGLVMLLLAIVTVLVGYGVQVDYVR